MNAADQATQLAEFPAALRRLVEAELAAGNRIEEVGHGYPAAPCGAYIRLAHPVTTRPREAAGDLDFYQRQGSSHSGEFTEGPRHFFVLEPPLPPPPEPDMNAIREASRARSTATETERPPEDGREPTTVSAAVQKFTASMEMNFDTWHDGTGYHLESLTAANPQEREALESLSLSRGVHGWRDAEALAALGTPRAHAALRRAFDAGNETLRMTVLSHAPEVLSEREREAFLVQLLDGDGIDRLLTEALLVIGHFHPRAVVLAMVRALPQCEGITACHLAAMLYYLHGKTAEPFSWNLRPFFLQFNTPTPSARSAALRTLCETLELPLP